jgi:nucleotide-binding universal stress UspA family protein
MPCHTMKNILVPTDFSDNAANALDYALGLARHTQGRLLLFHNSDIPLTYGGTNLFPGGDLALGADTLVPGTALANPELEKIYQEKLELLAEQVRRQTAGTLPILTRFQLGSLTENLNEIIRQEKVDLVVMGTQSVTTFLDRLIGTTTASVLKETHQAVLAIPANARFKVPLRIAFATDLASEDQVFLPQALAFARPFGAAIALVHINREGQEEENGQEQRLADLRRQFPEQALPLVTLAANKVVTGLETFVREYQADLIAVGLHERSFLASLFHSSVTEELAYHSTVPLLALPERPYSFS